MVQDASFRHISLRALALHAQRIGRVFAAFSSWARLVRERGWLRPRRRLYPVVSENSSPESLVRSNSRF